MWYLYLDESGDLVFDFVNKKPSKFFTVTILALRTVARNRELIKAVKTTIRRKFRKNQSAAELKGSASPLAIKKYFFRRIQNMKFAVYAVTLNKERVFEELSRDKERVYNYISRQVFDKIPFDKAGLRVEIIIDKSKTPKNISEFNRYIITQIKSKFNPKVPLNIYHKDSKQTQGLQAVDLFCWGIFRKYEKKDCAWYDVFKEKISCDEQYL